MRTASRNPFRRGASLSPVLTAAGWQMERVIQFLDEIDEWVMLMRHAAAGRFRRIEVQPGLLAVAVAATLLPL